MDRKKIATDSEGQMQQNKSKEKLQHMKPTEHLIIPLHN